MALRWAGVFLWIRFVDDVFILIDDNDNFDRAKELKEDAHGW